VASLVHTHTHTQTTNTRVLLRWSVKSDFTSTDRRQQHENISFQHSSQLRDTTSSAHRDIWLAINSSGYLHTKQRKSLDTVQQHMPMGLISVNLRSNHDNLTLYATFTANRKRLRPTKFTTVAAIAKIEKSKMQKRQ